MNDSGEDLKILFKIILVLLITIRTLLFIVAYAAIWWQAPHLSEAQRPHVVKPKEGIILP
jgi:hypothetical protein